MWSIYLRAQAIIEEMQSRDADAKQITSPAIVRMVMKEFLDSTRRYRYTFAVVIGSITAVSALQVLLPWYYKKFFDVLAVGGVAPSGEVVSRLVWLLAAIVGIEAIIWILWRCFGFTRVFFQPTVMRDLSRRAFDYLQHHSFRFFANSFVGSLTRKVNRLPRSFEDVEDQIEAHIIQLFVTVVGALVILTIEHRLFGVVLFAGIMCFTALQVMFAVWQMKYNRAGASKDSETTGVLADALTNNATVKLFSGYAHEKARYDAVTEDLRQIRFFTWGVNEIVYGVQSVFMVGLKALMIYIGIRLYSKQLVSIGDFVLLYFYMDLIFHQMWELGHAIRRVYASFADGAEMVEILNTPHEIQDREDASALAVRGGAIRFRDVDFRFHEDRLVLDRFALAVRPKEKVALVGPSGVGKSTVVSLLLRFHDVCGGAILIDGQNIADVTQESLRDHIAFVPQEPTLFHRTIRENICYGRRGASGVEVEEAARHAHCHEFITALPYGYDTYVGERGVKLSAGERQRVVIARAILKDAPILILDEATASLDSESERFIQDALKNLMAGKTVIVIAHRLSTIMQMDRIVVIDGGRVAAEGMHQELLEQDGLYRKLWQIQAGGFLSESLSTDP